MELLKKTIALEVRLKRRLKLRDLGVFVAVVAAGGMRKAAEGLHLSQSAVSKSIADLESSLGHPLLERSSKGVEPTVFGRALLLRSNNIFDELRQAVREVEFLADPSCGELCVGCTETIAAGLAAAAIQLLTKRYPRLVFRIISGEAPALQSHFLRDRQCELVIARSYSAVPESDMDSEPLFNERLHIMVGRSSKWASARKITLARLAGESWILSQNEVESGSPVLAAFAQIGIALPPTRVISGSLNLRYRLLESGEFVSVAPHSLLRFGSHRTLVKVLPIELPCWPLPTAIITLKNKTLTPMARMFIQCARDLSLSLISEARV